ncbi:unnamed protein product [marine sediment metagenome]|uniref:Damage-control phosphatase ARMT1-like metal-binding domain-containing protein n=1 Tax=marine sediment metagenome TaxID=412755 RepID=X1FGX6_9ZZZZ
MKTYLDCLPCMMQQALRAGRIATNDEKKIKELLDTVGAMIKDIPLLAESKLGFLAVKIVNIIFALITGIIGYLIGF